MRTRPLDASDVPGLLSIPRLKPKPVVSKNIRLTDIHGSVTGKDALALSIDVKKKKQEVANRKKATEQKRQHLIDVRKSANGKEEIVKQNDWNNAQYAIESNFSNAIDVEALMVGRQP